MKTIIALLLLIVAIASSAATYRVGTGETYTTIAQINALSLSSGDSVLFKRGESFYGTLTPNYSGVIYAAYGTGAAPIITGFTTITSGWTDEGGGIYSKVITSEAQTNMVTIDGVQYGMGRYPNATFLTFESAVSNTSITDNQLTGTPDWTGAEALIYKNAYRIERCVISSHSTTTLNYTIYSGLNTAANSSGNYFIQNDLETLDQYGEWYHDTGTGKFYMYFGAVNPATKTVKVATLNNLIKVTTAKTNITVSGLALTGSIKSGFVAEFNCHNLSVQNSSFTFAGADGVYIDGQTATVNNCTFNYCNRISVMTKGTGGTISNNTISNNAVVLGQGNYGYSGTSGLMIMGTNGTVTGNVVQNTATNGMFIEGTVDVGLVKNNYIYNTCLWNTDHGSIYTSQFYTNLVIDGNIIDTSKGEGIYLDAIGGGITVKNNSVTNCTGPGLHIHSQSADTIFNNTIFNCGDGVFLQNTSGNNDSHDVVMYNNLFVAKTATQKTLRFYSDYAGYASSWPTYSFYNNTYARPIDDAASLYYLGAAKTLAQWQTFTGQDASSTKSPYSIESETDLHLAYNNDTIAKPIAIPFRAKDMAGTYYATSITLQPFTSKILFRDYTTPPANRTKPIVAGGKHYISNGRIVLTQ